MDQYDNITPSKFDKYGKKGLLVPNYTYALVKSPKTNFSKWYPMRYDSLKFQERTEKSGNEIVR